MTKIFEDYYIPEPNSGCWLWLGFIEPRTGYAKLKVDGKTQSAHTISYKLHIGSVPDGKELHHTCRMRTCVNPEHLKPVTRQEHREYHSALQTHCKYGHEFTPANTILKSNWCRDCRTCKQRRNDINNPRRFT
jgi:HNH endonuclease